MSKAKSKYAKAIDSSKSTQANSIDYNFNDIYPQSSIGNSEDILENLRDKTYDLDRIKSEELNSNRSGTIGKSRYKKVYKSFRSAIRRGPATNSNTLMNANNKNSIENKNSLFDLDNGYIRMDNSSSLNIFQNGYSYYDNDQDEKDKLDFYKQTSYPFVKQSFTEIGKK